MDDHKRRTAGKVSLKVPKLRRQTFENEPCCATGSSKRKRDHAAIDRHCGFIRGWTVTSASAHDGAQLRNVLNRDNTGSKVWADTAYRSKKNEAWLERHGYESDIHHRKPKGRPMSEATSRANGRRSKVRAFVEHVFARQKSQMNLFIRTIGIERARVKIGMANIAYNLTRYVWHQGRSAPA